MKQFSCVAIMMAVACGGGGSGGGGTGQVTESQARSACQKICERQIDCGEEAQTLDECVDECTTETSALPFRADAIRDIADCQAELACGTSDDQCINECDPTSSHESYESACRAKAQECGITDPAEVNGVCETSPSDDDSYLCLLTPAAIGQLEDCLSLECDQIGPCFEEFYGSLD